MEIPAPRVRLVMDCLEGAWESLDDNKRYQFRGTVRFTMTSLVHPEIPASVIEALIEWDQPTPAQYARVAPAPVVEILSDPKDELEEDPEDEFADKTAPVSSSEASRSDGPGEGEQQDWLLESSNESSHQFHLEWIADRYSQWRADRIARPPSLDSHYSVSVSVSPERSIAPESEGSGSCIALVVLV